MVVRWDEAHWTHFRHWHWSGLELALAVRPGVWSHCMETSSWRTQSRGCCHQELQTPLTSFHQNIRSWDGSSMFRSLTVTCHINQTPLLSTAIGWFLSACLLLRVPVWLSAAVMRWAVGPRFRDQDPVTGTSHHQSWKWRFPEISQPRRRAFSLLKVPNDLLAISTFTKNLWKIYGRHYAY